jgi:hypothetical protein
MVKSIGCEHRPFISLTDMSGEELNSMEYLEFILESLSMFFLAIDVYRSMPSK